MSAGRRNLNVEALRLAAIFAIAVFHSFQTTFAQAALVEAPPAAPSNAYELVASMPAVLGVLGFINLLGAFGNHVFFAISGSFLVPAAARRSAERGYWADQARRTVRRAFSLIATVAFYALLMLAVNAWVCPVPGVGTENLSWLVGGLEFIWVYLALVVATPLMGWVWRRCHARVAVVVIFAVAVMLVNAYIAFVSPGESVRSLLEWRKLMSAVSYLVAYLAGAVLAQVIAERRDRSRETARATSRFCGRGLAAVIVISLMLEMVLAHAGETDLMVATSFKSTSLLSFMLALAALACALSTPSEWWDRRPRLARVVTVGAQGIVAFYVTQSMLGGLWRPAVEEIGLGVVTDGLASPMCAVAALLVFHLLFDVVFVAVALLFDALVRRPLFRLLHLG